MNLTGRTVLAALIATLAIAATVGLAYAAFDKEFRLPVQATVTVKLVSFIETADVNADGRVDRADLRTVAGSINTSPPGDERADVDNDGFVDIADLAFVARYFGLEAAPPTPTPTSTTPAPTATTPRPTATSPAPTATTPAPTPAPKTFEVLTTNDLVFVPARITIRVGDTVSWTNVSVVPHTITFADPRIPTDGFFEVEETFTVTFNTLGAFSYLCLFHPPDMVGSVRVEP